MATFRSCLKIYPPLPKSRNSHIHPFPHIAPLLPFQFANQNFHLPSISSFLTFKKFYVIIFKKTIFLSHLSLFTILPAFSSNNSHLIPFQSTSILLQSPPSAPLNTHSFHLLLIFIKKYVIILKKTIFYSLLTTVIAYSKLSQHHSLKENGETYHTSIGSFRLMN